MVVKSEEDSHILLESKIFFEDVYQRQQGKPDGADGAAGAFCCVCADMSGPGADTLVVWNDPNNNQDLALSFQEEAGCAEIWYTPTAPPHCIAPSRV